VAMLVMGYDSTIANACAAGSLELNPFLPLVAACLLESIALLGGADQMLRRHCIDGLEANEGRCREHVESSTAVATALLPALGYDRVCEAARVARETGRSVREVVLEHAWLSVTEFEALIGPEAVCRLGHPSKAPVAERRQP
jgi:aspartate ammonia-lyase